MSTVSVLSGVSAAGPGNAKFNQHMRLRHTSACDIVYRLDTSDIAQQRQRDFDTNCHANLPLLAGAKETVLWKALDCLSRRSMECGKDVSSKFWATYKKVSNGDFLGRANDDMDIPLRPSGCKCLHAILAFSVLAAFRAVIGKQWLNSYKAARGRGSLEERGIQRQMKLDGLEYFHLQTVLQAFLVLHQISLLFGLSLSANIFWRPNLRSRYLRTAGSELVGIICKKFLSVRPALTLNIFGKSFAIRWIPEASTNPEVVEAAAAMVPFVQWPELYVKYLKAMAHLCIQSVKFNSGLLANCFWNDEFQETQTRFIHDVFMAGRAAYDQLKNTQQDDARRKHQADARTALRTMLVHGRSDRLSRPDDEDLIWHSDLQWRDGDRHAAGCEEFDWLVDYLADEIEHVHVTDDETEGDALLALSAMHGLGSSAERPSYVRTLVHSREELASMTNDSMLQGVDAQLLNHLSRALLTAKNHDSGPDTSFHKNRDYWYILVIFALIKNDEWCQRLTRDGHLERCISLVNSDYQWWKDRLGYYLILRPILHDKRKNAISSKQSNGSVCILPPRAVLSPSKDT
ncbi:hypothetical protein EDB19DRAFT_2023698 [Suillus lakei]|nr:hypothetical protein EDB19DRAFT_2023698 [Suillus lakei]